MSKEFLWVEKYRPNIVEDCILPASTKEVFQGFVNQGELPNLLLTGTAGVGKTLKHFLSACREDAIFNNARAVFLYPEKFFTHNQIQSGLRCGIRR